MIIPLVRGVDRLGCQYLTGSIREAKCTRLGYRTRLSRLLTLDPPSPLAVPRGYHLAAHNPDQEKNHVTIGRV
jgi:hypothetical protein